MQPFKITVRTATSQTVETIIAASSFDAWDSAAADQGETPCAITVLPAAGAR